MKNAGKVLLIAGMVFAAANAYADSANGPYVGGGIGIYDGTVRMSNPTSGVTFDLGTGSLDLGVVVYGGYKYKFAGGNGSIAGEASYNSGVGKDGTLTVPASSTIYSMKNNWTVSVLPGYNLTPDTTSYLRLGYTRAKGEQTGTTPGSHTFNGYVLGFGVDQAIRSDLSARLEYRILNFSSWTDATNTNIKARSTGMDLTVRYAF